MNICIETLFHWTFPTLHQPNSTKPNKKLMRSAHFRIEALHRRDSTTNRRINQSLQSNIFTGLRTLRRQQAGVHAQKFVLIGLLHADRLAQNPLDQIRMRRTKHLNRSEAQLEDSLLVPGDPPQHLEYLVRILPVELQPVAEEETLGWNRWDSVREPVPQPEVHVRGQPQAGDQREGQQHGFTPGLVP